MRKTQCDIGGGNKITNKEMEHIKGNITGILLGQSGSDLVEI